MNKKITVIGCGRMGSAIFHALINSGNYTVSGVEKNSEIRARLAASGAECRESLSGAFSADVYIVAVKPRDMSAALDELAAGIPAGKTVVSIAAGLTVSEIGSHFREAVNIARVMPNTPVTEGEGMSCICFPGASDEERETIDGIFSIFGETLHVAEEHMNTVTAISGSGPAYFYLLGEVMEKFATDNGIPGPGARLLAAQTVKGAGVMMKTQKDSLKKLREDVTSPGGTTEAAIGYMIEKGFHRLFEEALNKAASRAAELSGGDPE